MIFVYIGVVLLCVLLVWKLCAKFLNPVTIFSVVWLIVVLLYQVRLSSLQSQLDDRTYWLLIINEVGFVVAFCIALAIRKKLRQKKVKVVELKEPERRKEIKIPKKLIYRIFVVWALVELFEVIYCGGMPIFWKLLGSSKTYADFGIPTLHGFMNAIGLVLMGLAFVKLLGKPSKKHKRRLIAILTVCMVFYLMLITRQVIISGVIQLFVLYCLYGSKANRKKIFVALAAIGLVGTMSFGIVGNFRTGYKDFLNVSAIETDAPAALSGFYWVYMYLTMSVANINKAVVLDINNVGGFYPIAQKFLPSVISRSVFTEKVRIPQYLVTPAFNVSGYFIDFYIGFGLIGVLVIALAYGVLGGIVWDKLRMCQNEKNRLYYAIYVQIIVLSFFFNHLLYLPSGFQFVLVWLIYRMCSSGKLGVEDEEN